MEIGSEVLWQGRSYVLVGVDPMNVPERRAYLRELDSEATLEVPYAELTQPPGAAGFGPER